MNASVRLSPCAAKRTAIRVLVAGVALLVAGCGAGDDEPVAGDSLVDVGGHRLHALFAGSGSPAVVIDTGFGDSSESWLGIQEALAERTRVIVYDRAGYGQSEPGPLPRDGEQVVRELRALLRNAGVPPPYVLVGHSLGGFHVQLFAVRHPDETVALVLLDPPPPAFMRGERFPGLFALADSMTVEMERTAEAMERAEDAEGRSRAAFQRALASEHRMLISRNGELARDLALPAELPVGVLASEVSNPAMGAWADDYQRYWIETNRQVAAQSAHSRFVIAVGSTHLLHRDAPALVVDLVEAMLDSVAVPEPR